MNKRAAIEATKATAFLMAVGATVFGGCFLLGFPLENHPRALVFLVAAAVFWVVRYLQEP